MEKYHRKLKFDRSKMADIGKLIDQNMGGGGQYMYNH